MKKYGQTSGRSLLAIFVIGLAFICTGCSFAISFNINNLSGRQITVRYVLKNVEHGLEPRLVNRHPANDNDRYRVFEKDRISVDTENRIVEFKLLTNEEVELFRIYDKPNDNYENEFNLIDLKISEGGGSIVIEGNQVYKSFRPIRGNWFEFGPEVIGFVLEYR